MEACDRAGIVYNYVTGVNAFGRFVRFDQDETLTDTNEFEYGFTQRLFRRDEEGKTEELVTWKIAEKYFFDPTFGGALVPGQRNVFQKQIYSRLLPSRIPLAISLRSSVT